MVNHTTVKLHNWIKALNDMYSEGKISEGVYHDSIESVWNIAKIVGETDNLTILENDYNG